MTPGKHLKALEETGGGAYERPWDPITIRKKGVVVNEQTGRTHNLSATDIDTLDAEGKGEYMFKHRGTGRRQRIPFSRENVHSKHLDIRAQDSHTAANIAATLSGQEGHIIRYPARTVTMRGPRHLGDVHTQQQVYHDMGIENLHRTSLPEVVVSQIARFL